MTDRSKTYSQATLWDTTDATSLLGSEDGTTRSNSPDGEMSQYGLDHAHVSHGQSLATKASTTTRATYGRISFDLSASQRLTSSLASKLQENTDLNGSPEYTLTWKALTTPSGLRISALRAKARPILDSGCTGWLTPMARGDARGERWKSGDIRNLEDQVQFCGLATPTTRDWKDGTACDSNVETNCLLGRQAWLAGWGTPTVQDARHASYSESQQKRNQNVLCNQVYGTTSASYLAQTENKGALNPAHSLWLMGYPVEWLFAAPLTTKSKLIGTVEPEPCEESATPSSLKSPQPSSDPIWSVDK